MREDPDDRSETFVVEVADDDEALRTVVDDADGAVERELEFDCLLVSVPEAAVDAICDVDEVVRVETAATLEVGIDDDSTKSSS